MSDEGKMAAAAAAAAAQLGTTLPADAEALKKRAAELKDEIANFRKYQMLLGMSATRGILRALVAHGSAAEGTKKALLQAIDEIDNIRVAAGYKEMVTIEGKEREVSIRIDECDAKHDLDAQFSRVKPYVTDEHWRKVFLPRFGHMVYVSRSTYIQVVHDNKDLMAQIFRHLTPAESAVAKKGELHVDVTNTTLYALEGCPRRVGFFIDSS